MNANEEQQKDLVSDEGKVREGLENMRVHCDAMAEVKNAFAADQGRRTVTIQLDENDPDPAKTINDLMASRGEESRP